MFSSSKTKHKEVWEVGAEVQRLIVDYCSYKCLHIPVWERIKNVAIYYHKTHLNFHFQKDEDNSLSFPIFNPFLYRIVQAFVGTTVDYKSLYFCSNFPDFHA